MPKRARPTDADASAPPSSAKRARQPEPRASWGGERLDDAARRRYGNHNAPMTGAPDPRLDAVSGAIFTGARVLDVGCGAGHVAIQLAEAYPVASVLGVDLDAQLVSAARRNLAARRRELAATAAAAAAGGGGGGSVPAAARSRAVPLSLQLVQRVPADALAAAALAGAAAPTAAAAAAAARLQGMRFLHEDAVGDPTLAHAPSSFDVVLCLGVTKWVQLNWGDRGLLTLFRRLHALLRPGGRLLLDAQPWRDYQRDSRLAPDMAATFAGLRLRPDAFVPFLLARVGFGALEATLAYAKRRRGGGGLDEGGRCVHILVKKES